MRRRLALAGMVALLVGGAACAETPEPETPDAQTPKPAQDNSIEAIRTRAIAGDADAQAVIGFMYYDGEGVPQDDVEAVAWWRQGAEQGHADAQYDLGMTYYNGEGVPQDDGEAYLWANLSALYADASDRDRYAEFRDATAERLTPEQRADAQRRAREWFEAHPPE